MIWVVPLSQMELIPHLLTPRKHLQAFVVYRGSVPFRALAPSAPYHLETFT